MLAFPENLPHGYLETPTIKLKEVKMKELSFNETQEVSGGFWPIIIRVLAPTIINAIVYSVTKHHKNEEITPQGLAIATGAGVLSGGIGAAAGAAAGGGIIGAAAWAPGTMAINASGNAIAQEY